MGIIMARGYGPPQARGADYQGYSGACGCGGSCAGCSGALAGLPQAQGLAGMFELGFTAFLVMSGLPLWAKAVLVARGYSNLRRLQQEPAQAAQAAPGEAE